MSRLIVVSNRVTPPSTDAVPGGLAVALLEALKRQGGIWCGWSGEIAEEPLHHGIRQGDIEYLTLDYTPQDYEDFYVGYCNSTLWPLFHYRLDLARFNHAMWDGYQRVNRTLAEAVAESARAGDVIWMHDYQLMTMGTHLRGLGLGNRLGFFLHIPFPVPEIMMALPQKEAILRGLCDYDLVGFQTAGDLNSFLRCVSELAGGKHRRLGKGLYEVQLGERRLRAGAFPISIDTEEFGNIAERAEGSPATLQLCESLQWRSMIIGVDRLDYSKGLPQRLIGYDDFLQRHPEYAGKVSYVQITPPSRSDVGDYERIREELDQLTARINGINAEIDWVPIRYINRSFSREELAGFYRIARVGLVTPLRDGMNLVAKEYVACQDPYDPGVLVLSQFAGAARELDAALIVNPFDARAVGEAIYRALTMGQIERCERHRAMMQVLRTNNIHYWAQHFLQQLGADAHADSAARAFRYNASAMQPPRRAVA